MDDIEKLNDFLDLNYPKEVNVPCLPENVSKGKTLYLLRESFEKSKRNPHSAAKYFEFIHKLLIYNPHMDSLLQRDEIKKCLFDIQINEYPTSEKQIIYIFFVLFDKYGIEPDIERNFMNKPDVFYGFCDGDHKITEIEYDQLLKETKITLDSTSHYVTSHQLAKFKDEIFHKISEIINSRDHNIEQIAASVANMSLAGLAPVGNVPSNQTPIVQKPKYLKVDRRLLKILNRSQGVSLILAAEGKQDERFEFDCTHQSGDKVASGGRTGGHIFKKTGNYSVSLKGNKDTQSLENIYIYGDEFAPVESTERGFFSSIASKGECAYITNRETDKIYISKLGKFEREISLPDPIKKPQGIACLKDGFVISSANGLFKVGNNFDVVTHKHIPTNKATFGHVSIHPINGYIYVRIQLKVIAVFDKDLNFIKNIDLNAQSTIQTICFNSKGHLAVGFISNCIQFIINDTLSETQIGKKGKLSLEFDNIQGISFDSMDNMVVCDTNNSRLQVISHDNSFLFEIKPPFKPTRVSCSDYGLFICEDRKTSFS